MFTKLLDTFGELALKRLEAKIRRIKITKGEEEEEEGHVSRFFLTLYHTHARTHAHTHRVLEIYVQRKSARFRALIRRGDGRRDATARDIQKGTRHPSTKIRKSNVQNEYGVAGASRVVRPPCRRKRRLRLSLSLGYRIYFLTQ